MKSIRLLCALALLLPVPLVLAAENSPASTSRTNAQLTNSKIDTWVEGTLKSLNVKDGTFVVNGVILPMATAHAQISPELQQKLAHASADQKKAVTDQFKQDLKNRVAKLESEKSAKTPQDFNLKAAPQEEMVVLNQEAVGEMITVQRQAAGNAEKSKPEWRGEEEVIGVYEAPQNVSYSNEKSKNAELNDLKDGEKVLVGFDSKSGEAFSVIRELQK